MEKWWNHDMMNWWYSRMLEICQYGFGVKWCNLFSFSNWWNGEISIWCNGDMMKFSNSELFFGNTLSSMVIRLNGEMVKKINSTMNYMVRFNCSLGYHIGFSLLDFPVPHQWYPFWQLFGISPVLFHHFIVCAKNIDSPLHRLENGKIVAPFHPKTKLTHSNHPNISPLHHIMISLFHHFTAVLQILTHAE